jgi:small subunit ribosomal protein S4
VNGKKVDRPSYLVESGDRVAISSREKSQKYARTQMQLLEGVPVPPEQTWLQVDPNKLEATVAALPGRDDVLIPVEEQLIVEFCSR